MKRVTKVLAVFLMVVGFAGAVTNLIATFTIDGPVVRVETVPLITMVFNLATGGAGWWWWRRMKQSEEAAGGKRGS